MKTERQKFSSSLLVSLKNSADIRGWRALFPLNILTSVAVGAGAAYFIKSAFWTETQWGTAVTLFGGLVTFNGLLLGLSWNAFSRIHSSVLEGELSRFMAEKDLLEGYLFYIDYVHRAQILCTATSGFALVSVLTEIASIEINRIIFGAVIATTIYATKKAGDIVTVMQDLVFQKAQFDAEKAKQKSASIHTLKA